MLLAHAMPDRHPDPAAPPAPDPSARRRWLTAALAAATGAAAGAAAQAARAAAPEAGASLPTTAPGPADALLRRIPSSGRPLPAIGLGTWITFNVGDDPVAREACTEVVRAFLDGGGRAIDSSPMYGSSQPVVGHALARIGRPQAAFSADKVWTSDGARGPAQMEASRVHWGVRRFDLLQVHNLVAWREHLPRLFEMKAAGRVGHVGVTTSEGRRHPELEQVMRTVPIDFVQVTYNLLDREVERRILPLALDRGIAVLVNRPFREGALLRALARHPEPGWARAIDCDGWAQVALKFVVSHPAVTCAIPATRRVDHVRQNLGAMRARQPDDALRARMPADVAAL